MNDRVLCVELCSLFYYFILLFSVFLSGSSVECYWHCTDETVHYKSDETVNFCGFRCATTSAVTVFINSVFFTFITGRPIGNFCDFCEK